MKYFNNRPYLLSRLAAALIASFGGFLVLFATFIHVVGTYFGSPMDAAVAQAATPRLALVFCLGLFLLLFGLVARAIFHMAAQARSKSTGTFRQLSAENTE